MSSNYYTSFGGTDITAVFNGKIFGELQMIQWQVKRDKAPVYTLGSVDPRSFARGKRLINGALVFAVFDKDTLIESMSDQTSKVWLSKDEIATYGTDAKVKDKEAVRYGGSARSISDGVQTFSNVNDIKQEISPILSDQLLPFDIVLVGASEYGKSISMTVSGVEILGESGGVSIDDISLEKQMAFLARRVSPWKPLEGSSSVRA